MGKYWQVSDNFHAYTEVLGKLKVPDPAPYDPYKVGEVGYRKLIEDPVTWDSDLRGFFEHSYAHEYHNIFFQGVLIPMRLAWDHYKDKNYEKAFHQCAAIYAPDWRRACLEWITRRQQNYEAKNS